MKNNTFYSEMEHPRWGLIMSVRANEEEALKLNAGDELFTYYGYKGPDATKTFPWYVDLYHQFEPQILERQKGFAKKARESSKEWKEAVKKKEEKERQKKLKKKKIKKKNRNEPQ